MQENLAELKCYGIEFHNEKNYAKLWFGENYHEAKTVFDETKSRDSFNVAELIEVTYRSKSPIRTKEKLIDHMSAYENYHLDYKTIESKYIDNNNVQPFPDTTDLCNYIDSMMRL